MNMETADLEPTLINRVHLFFVKYTRLSIAVIAFLLLGIGNFIMVTIEEEIRNKYSTKELVDLMYSTNNILDLNKSYSADYVYKLLEDLGGNGRGLYVIWELIDFVTPITYTLLYITAITFFFQKSFDKTSPIQKINLWPLIAYIADFFENSLVILLIILYPTEITILASLLPFFTLIKRSTQMVSWTLILIGAIILVIKVIQTKISQPTNEN